MQITDIIFGMVPEVIFFTLFIIFFKNNKNNMLKLVILTSINYIITGILTEYSTYSYIVFIVLQFLMVKLLYKKDSNIIDGFMILYQSLYLSLISVICFAFVDEQYSNYYILLFVNRMLLFVPIILGKKWNELYKRYCYVWNKREEGSKIRIKSITIRNISLIILNIFILSIDVLVLYIKTMI